MKKRKILSMFLLVFTLFGVFNFFNPTEVKAATDGTLSHPKTPNAYYTRRGGGKPYMSAQYEQYTMNGKVVYCIEPGVDITYTSYLGYDGLQASPYDDATNKKIELIGHYGYDYPGHQTLRYRMATQALIWETTGGQIIEFWTEQYGYGDPINVSAERNEIMRLVNAHYNKPSFNGSSMEVIIGKEYKITDNNGLMSEYELYKADNLNVRIEGNNIYVTPLATGNLTLSVVRKHYDNHTTIVYHGQDGASQKMGFFRFSDPVVASVKLNVLGGKIQIKKVDSETNSTTPQGSATLVGAKYNVINSSGSVVSTLTIGEDMTAITNNLPLGTYTIKEVSAPTGYELDKTTYTVTVNSSDTVNITVKDNVIKGKIKVVKYDSETNSCKAQGSTHNGRDSEGRRLGAKAADGELIPAGSIIYRQRGTKALIAALVAGGWVAVVVIMVICLIALLCSSIFGIFFSSEDTGGTKTMNTVVNEINQEMANKITNIQNNNTYDDYTIDSDRAEWKEVLAIYTVRISKGTNETDVITLDDNKISILKEVFWDMNSISSEVKTEKIKNDDGVEEEKKILHIKISSKSVEDMSKEYSFNTAQKNQLNELTSEEYANLWSSAIYGSPLGSPNIVQIALSQVGNVGGQPYWSWYGFNSRVEWCACFVSWVANQAGYIESNIIPKFAGCQNVIDWFKAMGQWKEKGYIPREGDIIFFDWEVDGKVNHVGIVERVENGKVYTVEGNSTDDMCRQKEYSINSQYIFGYGTPAY